MRQAWQQLSQAPFPLDSRTNVVRGLESKGWPAVSRHAAFIDAQACCLSLARFPESVPHAFGHATH